ncbi:homeobox-leucine zipper protein HOX9-like isoform X1 [Oryza glaberrima]|uniref:homeobox-leucine zipper protein HOX9-like isoform X1 n=1 Tax=Oryza glaberrima TaxID=4538 RepID=UPI00224BF2F6|nr:homeobox-leucine zipper protein HOX9-like isoform X1 [Oryza glaberrima]
MAASDRPPAQDCRGEGGNFGGGGGRRGGWRQRWRCPMRSGSGSDGGGYDKAGMDSGKYVQYTPGQVEALERVYAECPKPRFSRRQQLLCELSILANIEPKQKIKVWFPKQKVSKSMQGYTIKLVCLLCVWL